MLLARPPPGQLEHDDIDGIGGPLEPGPEDLRPAAGVVENQQPHPSLRPSTQRHEPAVVERLRAVEIHHWMAFVADCILNSTNLSGSSIIR